MYTFCLWAAATFVAMMGKTQKTRESLNERERERKKVEREKECL